MKRKLAAQLALVVILGILLPIGVSSTPSANWKSEVVIGVQSKTTTTNPTAAGNVAHSTMFKLTHNSLTGFNEATKEVLPELAKSWKISSDKKTWTFNLRDDVYFHNGEKMTADDWLFTIQYGKTANDGTVKAFYKNITSASAPDKNTLVINLVRPNMDLLVTLSSPFYSVLNKKAVEADPLNGPAIGTGPWVNKAFVSGDYTLLERFEKYWGEHPVTKTLRFRYIPEASARLIALENHEIDACQAPNNTELGLIKANKELKMISYQSSALTYLAFNMDSEVCRDVNLRLAIAYALNVQDIIDGAASGLAGIADGMWGFYQFGYFDDWKSVNLSSYDFNIQKAKEYMAKSKYAKGLTLSFMTSTTWRVNALQIIQQQLAPLGIKVTIDEVDAAGLTSKASSGNYQVLMYSVAFGPEGDDARRTLYPTSAANHAKYNNSRVTELLDLAAAESDTAKRLKEYQEVQVIVHTECPYIPLYYANSGVAIDKDLTGAVFSSSGAHDYTYVKVPAK